MKISLLIVSALLFTNFSFARSGDTSFGTRNGGNTDASEFFDLGIALLDRLLPRSPVETNVMTVHIPNMIETFKNTHITVSEKALFLNGSAVDAINYPKINRIDINGKTWSKLTKFEKNRLVIHEILGLEGIPDPQYRTSLELIEVARVSINRSAGYFPKCSGPRILATEKANQLIRALIRIYPAKPGQAYEISLNRFECRTGINLQNYPFKGCPLNPIISESQAEFLINALDNAQVASYQEAEGSPTIREVRSLKCQADSSLSRPYCIVNSYWNSGCSAE
ncbi:hypothetical protein [Bdellovibrio sp. HCB209]|uniref:hypothetical protein n=1 Tax=Bdellovibrio sp. HCB209 TaxID=3394354 RepID=UPI0039B5A860